MKPMRVIISFDRLIPHFKTENLFYRQMEDCHLAVFDSTALLYKQCLPTDLIADLLTLSSLFQPQSSRLGSRYRLDVTDLALTSDIEATLTTCLSSYYVNPRFHGMRMYYQPEGDIKPHVDVPADGVSTHTLLIYLDDAFEGGQLSVKVPRTEKQRARVEPDKAHHIFTCRPQTGYGILFEKRYLHWADYALCYKVILLVDVEI